jgi:RecA-family ATPase
MREQGDQDTAADRVREARAENRARRKGNGGPKAPALVRLDLAPYDTTPIPPRQWGVPERFPRRNVVLLSGHGGAGKSILLLQLAVAHVASADWLHSRPVHGPVVVVNCEDEGSELLRRLQPVVKHCRTTYAAIAPDLHVFPQVEALDNPTGPLLARMRNGVLHPTALYEQLLETVRAVRPVCTVVDNVADVFGGNEIDRTQVRQFVSLMRRVAIIADGYVILSAHPSVTGMANKSGLSGSTQWHNSVRARAYLRGPHDKEKPDENAPDSDIRILEFMKSNYSALAEQVELTWDNGLYVPAPSRAEQEDEKQRDAADKLFLLLLDQAIEHGANVSGNPASRNYAPRMFAKHRAAMQSKFGERSFADALSRLIERSQICAEPYGPPSDRTKRLIRRRLL